MRRGLPMLSAVLALAGATAAHAATPFVLPPRFDYAGLRCNPGSSTVSLVVGMHYGDIKTEYESVAFLVRNVGFVEASITGATGTLRVHQTERLPLGLVGRRNVDHRHTLLINGRKLASATGSSPCSSSLRLRIRVTQELRSGTAGGGAEAVDLPPREARLYQDLLDDMNSATDPDVALRRDAVAHEQNAVRYHGCLVQRRSRCPGADLTGALFASRSTTGGPSVGYGLSVSRIDLRGARLDGASLAGVVMNAAQLQGVVARGLQISGSSLLGASLASADLRGAVGSASWTTEHVLVPPFPAILQGANGSRANFSGAALRGATLSNGRFAGADFTGADLTDAGLEGANLRGANFHNADLSGATLLGADVNGANFAGANLSGTTDPAGEVIPNGTTGTSDGGTINNRR